MLTPWLIVAAWVVFAIAAIRWLLANFARGQVADRLYRSTAPEPVEPLERRGFLRKWLYLAGFRALPAPQVFLLATLILAAAGAGIAWIFLKSPLYGQGLRTLSSFPGGVGEVFLPAFFLGPWVAAILATAVPWLVVRRARRARVASIEQELPVNLELLATLSEAGLGFDAALARLLDSQPHDSPLSRELRTFQLDTLSGRSRIECFRRLADRVEVTALSVFVSAIVQAEQVGAAVADILRQQSNDLRDRRREDAMAQAMALPVKRLFPLMICFLPGIFVATLGPTFYQFFQYADTVIRLQSFGGAP